MCDSIRMTSHAALIMSAALLHRSPPLLPPSFAVKLQRRFQVQRLALVLHLHGLPLSLLLCAVAPRVSHQPRDTPLCIFNLMCKAGRLQGAQHADPRLRGLALAPC